MNKTHSAKNTGKGPIDVQLTIQTGVGPATVYKGRLFPMPSTNNRPRLTPREAQILRLLAGGKSNKEVAAALAITVKTAETHRTNIMRKLQFHSMSELVRYAIRQHLIEP